MNRILLILADGFEEIEALGTADVLRRLGLPVVLAGLTGTEAVTGAHGMKILPDTGLEMVKDEDFAAVILPGGMPGSANLDSSEVVTYVLEKASAGNRLIAAICAAPFVLAKRGLLDGKTFTMYPGFDAELGALKYTDSPAETCGMTVTGKGPGAVFAFARQIAAALGLKEACEKLYQGMFID